MIIFNPFAKIINPIISLACLTAALLISPLTHAGDARTMFITSATVNADNTVTFPLYKGTSGGRPVWYILLDTSDGNTAEQKGINRSSKLNNARGTAAVQKVRMVNGVIDFPYTVDFAPVRRVVPSSPLGFPPDAAEPGAKGAAGYSPLIEMPNGVILNAPQIANDSGQADKVINLDVAGRKVIYALTDGFAGGKAVKYVSTDASSPVAAALENVTYAPALNAAPFAGGDGSDSSRASLAAFINGQTGANNPQRQGLNSALLDGLDPLNVLAWSPNQGRYSPLWDVHLAQWNARSVANRQNLRQDDFGDIRNLGQNNIVTAPGGGTFGPAGFVVNCPIVSEED